jgi:hypothetical protein
MVALAFAFAADELDKEISPQEGLCVHTRTTVDRGTRTRSQWFKVLRLNVSLYIEPERQLA